MIWHSCQITAHMLSMDNHEKSVIWHSCQIHIHDYFKSWSYCKWKRLFSTEQYLAWVTYKCIWLSKCTCTIVSLVAIPLRMLPACLYCNGVMQTALSHCRRFTSNGNTIEKTENCILSHPSLSMKVTHQSLPIMDFKLKKNKQTNKQNQTKKKPRNIEIAHFLYMHIITILRIRIYSVYNFKLAVTSTRMRKPNHAYIYTHKRDEPVHTYNCKITLWHCCELEIVHTVL